LLSWLYRKGNGKEAKLSYIGDALTDNRHGLVVEAELGLATGTTEREAAQTMIVRRSSGSRRLTLGADKACDVREFFDDLRDLNVTPHIAQNTTTEARRSTLVRPASRVIRSVSKSANEPRSRSAGARPSAASRLCCAASRGCGSSSL
jgi:hypothetical protein